MKPLQQFMWGYQEHFQGNVESLAKEVFRLIGFEGEPNALLVGLAIPGEDVRNPVCLSPEDGRWTQEMFATLPQAAQLAYEQHPDQNLFYGDPVTMAEKPENLRRRAITDEVRRHLGPDDERFGVRSFCSLAIPYEKYYVVAVLQVPVAQLEMHPTIRYAGAFGENETNFIRICISLILQEAANELLQPWPQPGRMINGDAKLSAAEIVGRAAQSFMRIPFISGDISNWGLFDRVEAVAKLLYEREPGRAGLVLAGPDDPNIHYVMRLAEPVSLGEARWLRKMVEMSKDGAQLIIGYDEVYGIGSVSDVSAPPFVIDLIGPHEWDLKQGETVFLRVRHGAAKLAQEPISAERFRDNAKRIFERVTDPAIARMNNILRLLMGLKRGSLIIFAADAAAEADRLKGQGTRIVPTAITLELLERAAAIDGAILADPNGVCHAIGVILDGAANDDCTPSRGSRFNSAVRYVGDGSGHRLAFVVSDDATLDVVPLLRPQIDREQVRAAIEEIETADLDNFHKCRKFLDAHRFYLDEDQCDRINAALDRIEDGPKAVGQIWFRTARFAPNAAMNAGYFLPTDEERRRS